MKIQLSFEPFILSRRHPFGTAYATTTKSQHVLIRLKHQDLEGLGEAAPVTYHQETFETVISILQMWQKNEILGDDPFAIIAILRRLEASILGNHAAKAAVEMALHDLCGKIVGKPVNKLLGLSGIKISPTSFTIGIDEINKIEQKVEEALKAGHKILKVKQGTSYDREIITSIRRIAPHLPLRVDANGAWNVKQAIAMSHFLAEHAIEFIEQPLPKHASFKDYSLLRKQSALPIFLDESICRSYDVSRFADAADGVVVKLSKAGGLLETLKVIHTARAFGMQILFGCMVESSIGITAAAHLAGLVDHLDLDGNLLLENDPFQGVTCQDGHLTLPDRPGLGVIPKA